MAQVTEYDIIGLKRQDSHVSDEVGRQTKIYHIAYGPMVKTVHLHFWGCNLRCRACFLQKEIYDCHQEETREGIYIGAKKKPQAPEHFLALEEVMQILRRLEVKKVIFMGAEATIDRQLPQLAEALHREFGCYNLLLTNGFRLPSLKAIDEVVFSIKAHTDSLYRYYTGKSNKKTLENFIGLYKSGVKLRAECVFIPEYIDYPEIENIAKFIAEVDKNINLRIDAYFEAGDNPWRRPTSQEMKRAVGVARKYLLNVSYLAEDVPLKSEVIRIF